MAMLYLLHRFDVNTIVVHCNYQLRGKASDKDQKLVEEICMLWNVECVSARIDSDQESTGNFQEWARDWRYLVFRDIKKEFNSSLILTAHHHDDQLETLLQKILRGSGIASWKGMDVLDGDLFRPFLNVSKKEIMEFVESFNVPYRIDRTNEESTYARNFIRNHWFPDLNRLFPGWKENLLKISERAEEFRLMSETVLKIISEGERELNRNRFLKLDSKIRPAIFLHFIKESGIEAEISSGFLESLQEITELQSGNKIQISDQYFLVRDREYFKIVEDSEPAQIRQKIGKNQLRHSVTFENWQLCIEPVPEAFSPDTLYLDLHRLEFPIRLRRWKDGDFFQPLGMEGSQLISDHLTNRKIPSTQKKEALVLESFDSSICAVIFPNYSKTRRIGTISEMVRCTSSTTKTLTIKKID